MSECDSCSIQMESMTLNELQNRTEKPFNSVVHRNGSPIGFPMEYCSNPFCDVNYGSSLK